jgi:hypothetical protein
VIVGRKVRLLSSAATKVLAHVSFWTGTVQDQGESSGKLELSRAISGYLGLTRDKSFNWIERDDTCRGVSGAYEGCPRLTEADGS